MKSILISIQPKWCELIASGKKTIEVTKTRPKIETPFKCYIYCTKENKHYDLYIKEPKAREKYGIINRLRAGQEEVIKTIDGYKTFIAHGKVIGEFVCDSIDEFLVFENGTVQYWNYHDLEKSCLTYEELSNYIGKNKKGYGWHISNLVIYDKPKELSEFRKYYECDNNSCGSCNKCDKDYHLTRPPQSWCYVLNFEGVFEIRQSLK